MKKLLLGIFFLFLMTANGKSQEKKKIYVHNGIYATLIESPGYYKGASFYDSYWNMDPEWVKGVIYMPGGKELADYALRFNITRDRFEVHKDNDEKIYLINPDSIIKIKRQNETFIYSPYDDGTGFLAKGYFKLLIDGDTRLLFKKREVRKDGKNGAFGYDAYKTFVSEYYLKKKDDPVAHKIKKTKKSILEALSDQRAAVEAYAKKNKLRFSNERGLSAILNYYDSLKDTP